MANGTIKVKTKNSSEALYPRTLASLVSGLATVATTGSYSDLSNKPNEIGYVSKAISSSGGSAGAFTSSEIVQVSKDVCFIQDTSTSRMFVKVAVEGPEVLFVSLPESENISSEYIINATKLYVDTTDGSYTFSSSSLNITTSLSGKMTNPMTTQGDIIYGGTSGAPTRLAKGSAGQVLKINSNGNVSWSDEEIPSQIQYQTTAPTSNNTSGYLKIVVLTTEPSTYYNGYLYLITA